MARIIALISFGVSFALSVFVWEHWGSSPLPAAAGDSRSLAIEDVMRKVDNQSLSKQQIQDRTVVFPEVLDQ
jgi:hypothetical protein